MSATPGAPVRLPHPRTGVGFPSPVPPGSGWPADPAGSATPVARSATDVVRLAEGCADLAALDAASSVCRACPRLVTWREDVAVVKRRAFRDQPYWGRPAPGFGDTRARLLVDGLVLTGVRMVAAVRCAPPGNAPLPAERDACNGWLRREVEVMPAVRAVLALGAFGWGAFLGAARGFGWSVPTPAPRFGHGVQADLIRPDGVPVQLVGSYHVSQQNTQTGRLTQAMLDAALAAAVRAARAP